MLTDDIYDLGCFNGHASDAPDSGRYPSLDMDHADKDTVDSNSELDPEDSAMDALRVTFGLHHLCRHVGLLLSFLLHPYTVAHVRYDLAASFDLSCTIRSGSFYRGILYNINLSATHTTILSTRGVQIPIYLVSSATDSFSDA